MELTGEDVLKVMHAYGTNGIITEVEMPLTASYDWIDVIVGFDDFMDAARFGNDLGIQDGILAKLITPIAAPIPYDYFKRHQKYLAPRARASWSCMIAPHAHGRVRRLHRARQGRDRVPRRQGARTSKGLPPAYELTWNHTTLRAIRVDPTITYLQIALSLSRITSPTSRRW